ncbi:hypothetical protein M3Y95_00994800 [Aphelenchoides besseyi]|nr:hypothetical protein M3Y95_00994800 [Aphelenchoides besseyi]
MAFKLIASLLFIVFWTIEAVPLTSQIHAFDIYPIEFVQLYKIIYDQTLSKQFLDVVHKTKINPEAIYAEVRYEQLELEKHVRPIIVDVQQKATRLTPAARDFLELISKHVEIVLAGTQSQIHDRVKHIVERWSEMETRDRESYRDQFPDSAMILDNVNLTFILLLGFPLLLDSAPLVNSAVPPVNQIHAIFPSELFHLRIPTTEEQREFIVKTINEHPENEAQQWVVIKSRYPRLGELAQAVFNYMKEKESKLSPSGRLLFSKLIDGVPIIRFGNKNEIKKFVFEALRLWYSMDHSSKRNYATVLSRSASALSNPSLVPYVLAETSAER